MTTIKPHKLIRFAAGPICPRCSADQFDDWWHVLRDRKGRQPSGKLTCGACDKAFFIDGTPGFLFSTAFGLDQTDHAMRAAGL